MSRNHPSYPIVNETSILPFPLPPCDQVPVASDGILDYAAADALEFCVEAAHYHNADTIYAVKVSDRRPCRLINRFYLVVMCRLSLSH